MKPWMEKSGIGLSGRIPVTTEQGKDLEARVAALEKEVASMRVLKENNDTNADS